MMILTNNRLDVESIVKEIKKSKKYRYISEDTIRAISLKQLTKSKNINKGIKAVRKKLHRVAALYLGDPDYDKAHQLLARAFTNGDPDQIKEACINIMKYHSSTRERLPLLEYFYEKIFDITGVPSSIIDVACGLNPLSFPWMKLPTSVNYYVYEIHEERIEFLRRYFTLLGVKPLVRLQDVLVTYPREKADIAFLLKMIHCFERREQGCTLPLLEALKVDRLIVSFPTKNLPGTQDLRKIYKNLMYHIIKEKHWHVSEITFDTEMVFCIKK